MDIENKKGLVVFALVIIAAIVVRYFAGQGNDDEPEQLNESNGDGMGYDPYSWHNGWMPSTAMMNNSTSPFTVVVNNEISAPSINSLTAEYMPTFGFVGVVGG